MIGIFTNDEKTDEKRIPEKIPEISIAAANMPAVAAYCGFDCEPGAYIIANELR